MQRECGHLHRDIQCPPDSCAELLDSACGYKQYLVVELLRTAQSGYWLEKHRHKDPLAMQLWRDCWPLHNKVVRLLFAFFERDGENSVAGNRLLVGCIKTLADNKGVEELHHFCKQNAKKNACKKTTSTHVQQVVLQSQVLEKRGIRHAAAITKQTWRKLSKNKARFVYSRKNHRASSHKLPALWSAIMGPKMWRTTSETEGRISSSAWHWLQTVGPFLKQPGCLPPLFQLSSGVGVVLARALFSRFLLPKLVVRHQGCCWATLGRGKWACLGLESAIPFAI